MFFSEAPLPVLALGTDWLTWTFVLDDMVSDFHQSGSLGLERAVDLVTRLTDVLGQGSAQSARPIERALAHLTQRTSTMLDPAWRRRFLADVTAFVEGYAWEARNLSLERTPDLVDHIQTRRQLSGAVLTLDLVELSLGVAIPPSLYATRPIRVLVESAADHIMYVNDIFSLNKEIAHLDLHNNVHIIHTTLGLGLQESVDFVNLLATSQIRLHKHTVKYELPDVLDQLTPDEEPFRQEIGRWIRQLEGSMAASLKWHQETHRYHDVELWRPPEAPPETESTARLDP